jgi:hypothetical protein
MKVFHAVWTSWNTTLFGFVPYASFTVHVMTSRCIVMFSVSIWMASSANISYSNSLFIFQWCQGTQLSSLTRNTWMRLHICPAVYGRLIRKLIFGMKNCMLNSCTVYCKLFIVNFQIVLKQFIVENVERFCMKSIKHEYIFTMNEARFLPTSFTFLPTRVTKVLTQFQFFQIVWMAHSYSQAWRTLAVIATISRYTED